MRLNIYVDGFNLYYGCVKGTPHRWLDLGKLFKFMFPRDEINRIRYFTAMVKPIPGLPDDGGATRQGFYIRALETVPNLSTHFGSFISEEDLMPRSPVTKNPPEMVRVITTEEKGSDVNLATFLMFDCAKESEHFDKAVIVSADSDFELPIELARIQYHKDAIVLFPGDNKSGTLRRVATNYRKIAPLAVQACQFPNEMEDWKGKFHKPPRW